jgi:hypothetical protein
MPSFFLCTQASLPTHSRGDWLLLDASLEQLDASGAKIDAMTLDPWATRSPDILRSERQHEAR